MGIRFLMSFLLRAYVISIGVFVILHMSFTIALQKWLESGGDVPGLLYVNLAAYGLYLVTGFLAGVIIRRHQFLHGIVAAVLAASIASLAFGVGGGDPFGIFSVLVNGAVLGGIGGAFSLVLQRATTLRGHR